MTSNNFPYSVAERLSFLRIAGTDEEMRAANILLEEIEKLGGKGELMEFDIPAFDVKKCAISVKAPYEMELECAPYYLGSTPEGGIDLKLMYAERGLPEDFDGVDDLSDTIVMVNEFSYDVYKLLCEKKAAAFITIFGKHWDSNNNLDLVPRMTRMKYFDNGRIPGFQIWAKDATELVRKGAETIHIDLQIEDRKAKSHNVLATIPGTDKAKESIVITAHYDSVAIGTGAWDNATGSAAIMYIYRHFLQNAPRRTLRFVWCGAEEIGLLGSIAYVDQNPELIEKEIKFCFNFDMCGTVLGPNLVFVTGGDDLKHYAEQYCREVGKSVDIKQIVHSSDSAPFCDKGIPALGLSRGSKTAEIHTRNDIAFPLSAKQLEKDADFAAKMIERAANSARLPVDKGMNDTMKEALKKYFLRDKTTIKEDLEAKAKAEAEKEKK